MSNLVQYEIDPIKILNIGGIEQVENIITINEAIEDINLQMVFLLEEEYYDPNITNNFCNQSFTSDKLLELIRKDKEIYENEFSESFYLSLENGVEYFLNTFCKSPIMRMQ